MDSQSLAILFLYDRLYVCQLCRCFLRCRCGKSQAFGILAAGDLSIRKAVEERGVLVCRGICIHYQNPALNQNTKSLHTSIRPSINGFFLDRARPAGPICSKRDAGNATLLIMHRRALMHPIHPIPAPMHPPKRCNSRGPEVQAPHRALHFT